MRKRKKLIPPEVRFWHFVRKNDQCWEWLGAHDKWGYPKFGHTVAHRFSYALQHGEIPKGLSVIQRCDNKGCVNPQHLYLAKNRGTSGKTFRKTIIDPPQVRFWRRVIKTGTCWFWDCTSEGDQYGFFFMNDKRWLAHRASYELFVAHIPDRLFVLHSCDNPPCVRPDHLWLGTQKDNMADAARKGRSRNRKEVHRII